MQKTDKYKSAIYYYVLENGTSIPILKVKQIKELSEEIVLMVSFVDMHCYRIKGIKNYYFCHN